MGSIKEGGTTVRPPLFDGTTYGYWKVRMTSFIRSVEEAAWSLVEDGWWNQQMNSVQRNQRVSVMKIN